MASESFKECLNSLQAGGANACCIDAYFPILPGPMSLQEAMAPDTAEKNPEETARQAFLLAGKPRLPAEKGERP
jgi:hypothetical protein